MGVTLAAILTAALLLPGIIAVKGFYLAGQTREVEVAMPSLSTAEGIALVGSFSVVVHVVYVLALELIAGLPPLVPLPLANPYLLFSTAHSLSPLDAAWNLFAGLALLSLAAFIVGRLTGWAAFEFGERSRFYGPLSDVIQSAAGDDKFITAYVLTKLTEGKRVLGYEGTVDSLYRDADRYPAKVVLKEVVPFYLQLDAESPKRIETDQLIEWLALSASDWHNIAFKVFQLVDDDEPDSNEDPKSNSSD